MFVALEFFEPFAKLLAFFYSIWPSYGGAIALFTLTVMVVLTPLTLKGTRSMMVLQSLQPEMKRIQAQYKDDRQKLNEELLKFYKENNINPLGGCLPLLVQIPVFIILYNVLRGLTATKEIIDGHEVFAPKYLDHSSKLYEALHSTNEMKSWGLDLSKSVTQVMSNDGFVHALPFIIIICAVAATSFIQQKQISGRNPAAANNPQQQLLMKLGPIMLTGISIIYQGGLVIYLFISNLFRVGQQALISRTIYNTPEAKKLLEQQMKDAEARKKSGAAQGGFFKQLLGDAAPQLNKAREAREARDKAGTNGGGKTAAKPPAARASNGGRTTPPKNRTAAARKKKKRK
jgi:YidC/Oxa1 family membrane protein insertase